MTWSRRKTNRMPWNRSSTVPCCLLSSRPRSMTPCQTLTWTSTRLAGRTGWDSKSQQSSNSGPYLHMSRTISSRLRSSQLCGQGTRLQTTRGPPFVDILSRRAHTVTSQQDIWNRCIIPKIDEEHRAWVEEMLHASSDSHNAASEIIIAACEYAINILISAKALVNTVKDAYRLDTLFKDMGIGGLSRRTFRGRTENKLVDV